jgi:hypothetical protein
MSKLNGSEDDGKLIPGITTYPDLGPPEVLPEGYKTIKLLPGQQNPPPRIKWGQKFDALPVEQQIKRAKKVADAMNHAADVAQQRVSELIDIANHQERQLELNKVDFENQRQTMALLATRHNAENQARMAEMQEIKMENKRLRDALLVLGIENDHLAFVRDALSGKWQATMDERKSIGAARRELDGKPLIEVLG